MTFDSMHAMYGHLATVVQRAGRVYPAAFEQYEAVASVGLVAASSASLWIDPALRAAGERHLRAVAARSPGMHDGNVEACVSAEALPLRSASGSYFDAIATSDSLRAEYVELRERHPDRHADLAALPLRALAHAACGGDALRSGQGRVAALGVSVVVTLPWNGGRGFVLGRRSRDLATDPDMWHVAPSGTLEPAEVDPVIHVVRQELAEELDVRLNSADELAGRLTPLGVGFDLLRLRPEICLRLDLLDGEHPSGGPVLNGLEFEKRAVIELSRGSMAAFWESHRPDALTPAAAAAIALLEQQVAPH